MRELPISGSYRPTVMGMQGVVASGHYLASLAAQRILQKLRDDGRRYASVDLVSGGRVGDIDQVVRNATAFTQRQFGRADIEVAINLQ